MPGLSSFNMSLFIASETDRRQICRIRYAIYARELQQHQPNEAEELKDELDAFNHYIVAKVNGDIAGFISITPPASPKYSVDKYFDRSSIPYAFDESLYEIRLLTVLEEKRRSALAFALMYAAYRWVQSHGGKYIVSIMQGILATILNREDGKTRRGAKIILNNVY